MSKTPMADAHYRWVIVAELCVKLGDGVAGT